MAHDRTWFKWTFGHASQITAADSYSLLAALSTAFRNLRWFFRQLITRSRRKGERRREKERALTRVAPVDVTNDGRFMIINVKFDSRLSNNDLLSREDGCADIQAGEGGGRLRGGLVTPKKGGHSCVLWHNCLRKFGMRMRTRAHTYTHLEWK